MPVNKFRFYCEGCNNEFYAWKSQKKRFCSNLCRLKSLHRTTPEKRKTGEVHKCLYCGKEFYVANWKKSINKGKFCSRECYGQDKSIKFTGKNNPQYIDGRVREYSKSFYFSINWRKLRKLVYERDKYTCQDCWKKGGRLHAHHKIPVGICKNPLDMNNIKTLCQKCHNKLRRK